MIIRFAPVARKFHSLLLIGGQNMCAMFALPPAVHHIVRDVQASCARNFIRPQAPGTRCGLHDLDRRQWRRRPRSCGLAGPVPPARSGRRLGQHSPTIRLGQGGEAASIVGLTSGALLYCAATGFSAVQAPAGCIGLAPRRRRTFHIVRHNIIHCALQRAAMRAG